MTSSLDWSVKLWNLEASTEPILTVLSPNFDYITDAKWSPINPSMFSTITSGGELQIWDIGVSSTRPRDSIQVIHDGAPGAKTLPSKEAVNKVMWSRDGRQV